jgi:hypothetical protein
LADIALAVVVATVPVSCAIAADDRKMKVAAAMLAMFLLRLIMKLLP